VKKVLAQLRDLHSHRAHYRPCDVSFLMSPAATDNTIRRQGVSRVQDWLETWKPYFRQSLQCASAAASTVSTRRISDHFPVLHRRRFSSRSQPPASPPVAAGHESGRLLSALLQNIFGLHLLDSAFIHLHPPGPSMSCSESECYDRGSNLFSPSGRRSRQRNINDITTFLF
jgi:hypothetical protein